MNKEYYEKSSQIILTDSSKRYCEIYIITNTINNYEPRVNLIDVVVSPNYDENEFNVTINYRIVGIDVLPQQLSFALQPTR